MSRKATRIIRELDGFQQHNRKLPGFLRPSKECNFQDDRFFKMIPQTRPDDWDWGKMLSTMAILPFFIRKFRKSVKEVV